MKLAPTSFRSRGRRGGWALLAVMTLAAVGLMVLAGVMSWANENAAVAARNNEYFATCYAAESATEKVYSIMSEQYLNYGPALITANLSSYPGNIPTSSDGSYWASYQFSGGTTPNQIIVTETSASNSIVMGAPFSDLTLTAATYEIIANAQNTTTEYKIVSTVGEQIYLGTIPLFQFAIFYQNDMEIAPGAPMTITGLVHGNGNIYLEPQDGLTLDSTVSAVDQVIMGESPLDPSSRTFGPITFDGYDLSGVNPLNLPVGTNTTGTVSNTSQNVYAILEPPQPGQGLTSATGTNLLYNKADMIITISNNNSIYVTSGALVNNQATVISNSQWQTFLSTNGSFYDQRDSLTVDPVTLNVSNLVNWSATNSVLRPVLSSWRGSAAADVQSIYVDDQRTTTSNVVSTVYTYITNYTTNATTTSSYPAPGTYVPPITSTNTTRTTTSSRPTGGYIGSITTNGSGSSKTYTYNLITGYTYNVISSTVTTTTGYQTNVTTVAQPGIVLSNGAVLPPQGLSVATPDPAYIIGNWNVQLSTGGSSDSGTSNTSYSLPSAVYADAITVLSSAWNPANSALAIGSRTAASDTVNAAFLTGNVPSDGNNYSGGVENFPRFLENWSGQTFTYNGSMVCMFSSEIADAPWPGTGTVYNPPTRNWAFDNNFNNPAKQPPMMPRIVKAYRSQWTLLKPYTTSF